MTKAKSHVVSGDKTYSVTSPAGIKAVQERITFVSGQIMKAIDEKSHEEAIRIYKGVKLMLGAMLEAGPRGISTYELRAKAKIKASLDPTEIDQAMVILVGHMARVRKMISEQQSSESTPVQPARSA